jgi:filamentous hemagglutinin
VNSGEMWSGNDLVANATYSVTNTGTASGSQGLIDAGNSISISAILLRNNSLMTSGGDISLSAYQILNEVAGGDTRVWVTGNVDSSYPNPDTWSWGAWNAGAARYEWWQLFNFTRVDYQTYAGGTPTFEPQIVGAGTVTLKDFNTAKNTGAVIQGSTVNLTGQGSYSTFTNTDLSLLQRNYSGQYVQHTVWTGVKDITPIAYVEDLPPGTDGLGFSNLDSTTVRSPSPVTAGIYATYLNAGNLGVLKNDGTPYSSTPPDNRNSNDVSGKKATTSANGDASTEGALNSGPKVIGGGIDAIGSPVATNGDVQGAPTPVDGGAQAGATPTGYVVSAPSTGASQVNFNRLNIQLPTNPNGNFIQNPSSDARYLVETNPLYLSSGNFSGSSFLATQLGYDPDTISKRLGDGSYEAFVVREQMVAQTGRALISGVNTEAQQMQLLMNQAIDEKDKVGLVWGQEPTNEQLAKLKTDIVWMVPTEVNGQVVLAPVVYLCQATRDSISHGAVISADVANLKVDTLTNNGGVLEGKKSLTVTAKNDITNISGTIKGGNLSLTSTSGNIVNKTFTDDSGSSTVVGKQAVIAATGNLNLNAAKDISNLGANMSAGGSASLTAGGSVVFDTIQKKTTSSSSSSESGLLNSKSTSSTTNTVTQIKPGLTVGGDLAMKSGKDIVLAGTDATVGGNADLDAKGEVKVISRANTTETRPRPRKAASASAAACGAIRPPRKPTRSARTSPAA